MADNNMLYFDDDYDNEEEIEFFESDSDDDFIKGSWEQEKDHVIDMNVPEDVITGDLQKETEDVNTDVQYDVKDQDVTSQIELMTSSINHVTSQNDLMTSPSSQPIERMKLNDHKAGMEGLDKEKINKIIHEASKGSKYYENEKRKEKRVQERIDEMKRELRKFTNADKERALLASNKVFEEIQKTSDFSRTLVHVDMDAFYAAVEMRDNPELKTVPMAVGGNSMLSTSNYLARKFGVRAAMPGFIGKKLCPELVIVPSHFNKYREASSLIRDVFKEYDTGFSPMSLDEAYLDITDYLDVNSWKYQGNELSRCPCELVVEEIREKIFAKTQLTASAGIAPNLMLSKICSDLNKPNGQYYLRPDKTIVNEFMRDLPIRKVFGIGRVTEQMLKVLGVIQCKDLLEQRTMLYLLFSETSFHYFMRVALGISSNRITNDVRKSMSVERTFTNEHNKQKLIDICQKLCEELAKDLKKENIKIRNITLKYKLSSFVTKTRSKTIPYSISTADQLLSFAKDLLLNEIRVFGTEKFELRLMGIRGTHFDQGGGMKQNTVERFFNSNVKKTGNNSTDNEAVTIATEQLNSCKDLTNVVEDPKTDTVECPVCGLQQSSDTISLNLHIDSCLTKQTIKEILKEQKHNETTNHNNSGKRKSKGSHEETTRPKKKTLMSFWTNK